MNKGPDGAPRLDRAGIDDCWNRIGVRGDGSCPELVQYVHCRNCPVFSAGAAVLLDADASAGYVAERTATLAQPVPVDEGGTQSIVIFRVAGEWFGLPMSVVVEVANVLPIHSLPHRRSGAVLGLASVRGELLVCVSLGRIVGAVPLAALDERRGTAYPRLLVIRREAVRVVCPVDEVHGVHRFHPRELQAVPTTVAKATVAYSTALLPWQGHSVGTLDAELLFYTMRRSFE